MANDRWRKNRLGAKADPASLDEARHRRMPGRQKPPATRPQRELIIPDKASETPSGFRRVPEHGNEPRFARAGRSAHQHTLFTEDHRRGVDIPPLAHGPATGNRTMKRAPQRLPASSMMFSARIVPLCASTICFEIERPRPEFCPKP